MAELQFEHFPQNVRIWAQQPPTWLRIESPASMRFLERLSQGEASAISLASEQHAAIVLIDERAATEIARSIGLKSVGTLAVLLEAGYEGLIDFHRVVQRLTTQPNSGTRKS